MMYYFKKMFKNGQIKFYALSKQEMPCGTKIPTNKAISNLSLRITDNAKIGAIFAVGDMEINKGVVLIEGTVFDLTTMDTDDHIFMDFKIKYGDTPVPVLDVVEERPTRKTYMNKLRMNPKYSVPTIQKEGFYVDMDAWYLAVRNIKQKQPILFTGPTGLGKTSLAKIMAQKMQLPFNVYDMGTMLDPHAGLLGVHRLNAEGSVFDYSKFSHDIQEPGIILLDELSRAPLIANNILFPVLDWRRELPVDIASGHGTRNIQLHKDCVLIATANEGSDYSGTAKIDKALRSRFFVMELDYMPVDIEIEVLCEKTMIDKVDATTIVKVATNIRKNYALGDLSDAPGTRETLLAASLVVDGYTPLESLEYVFLPMFEGTKSEGERMQVTLILSSS